MPEARPGRHRAAEPEPLIPSWVRVLVVLTVLPVWAVVVLWSLLVEGVLPETPLMMIPSAVIVAVAPAWRRPAAKPSRGGDS